MKKIPLTLTPFHISSIILCVISIFLCAGAFFLATMLSNREINLQTAKIDVSNRNNVRFADESIQQALLQVEMVLGLMKMDMETLGYIPVEHQALLKLLSDSQNFDQVAVADAEGNLIFSAVPLQTKLNIVSREHFQAQIKADTQKIYIAAPWISRATGKPNIFISRRVNDPQGNFAGIVSISLKQNFLDSLFRKLELGESHFITLVRRDGIFLARSPFINNSEIKPDRYINNHAGFKLINQGVMDGTYVTTAENSVVGLTRSNAFKVLPDYPLVILTGVTLEDGLRDTFQLQKTYYYIASAFSTLVLIFFLAYWWLLHKQYTTNKELEYLSGHDKLTGLLNRYCIEKTLDHEIARAERYQESLSMIIFDLDHFKKVNDHWGHPVGDEVLKQVAQITTSTLRKSDVLVRMGGEEFMAVMPQLGYTGAIVVAEKIRLNLSMSAHPKAGIVTASLGVAERRRGESFEEWYKRADWAMYQAKTQGRNRVVSADENT